MKNKSFLIKLTLIVVVILCTCVSYVFFEYRQYRKEEAIALQEIAERTGLPADWLAIREYVYCDLLKPGTPIEEVEKGLALIGDYDSPRGIQEVVSESFSQEIDFVSRSTGFNLCPLIILYDKNMRVEGRLHSETPNYGPRSSCEIEQSQNVMKTMTAEAYLFEE